MTVSIFFGGLFFSLQYTTPEHRDHAKTIRPEKPLVVFTTMASEFGSDPDKKEANLELLALTTADFLIRAYMTLCVYSLYVIYWGERVESDFMNGSDKQRLSYNSGSGSDKMTDNCSVVNER